MELATELTSAALWLNSFFAVFDRLFLSVWHFLAEHLGVILTPIMRLISFLGEKGLVFFAIAIALMCFSKTRKFGICLFGAVCCGALITNIILKDAIARPRPFESSELFLRWWETVGSPEEDGFSFPSGHVTATAAGMTAICLMKGKKWIVPSAAVTILMAISRNYLMAHYPSDVLAAILIGLASGFLARLITALIYALLSDYRDTRLGDFVLNWDLPLRLPSLGYKGKHEI